jgi:hypothetical protein
LVGVRGVEGMVKEWRVEGGGKWMRDGGSSIRGEGRMGIVKGGEDGKSSEVERVGYVYEGEFKGD